MRSLWRDGRGGFGLTVLTLVALLAVGAPFVAGPPPGVVADIARLRFLPPFASDPHGVFHLLGTDRLGRDVWARLLYGARISLAVGALAVLLSVVIGTAVGAVAGFFRGPLSAAEIQERLAALNAWCRQRYPALKSVRVIVGDEHHSKWVATSTAGQSLASIQRAACQVVFVARGATGAPVELAEQISGKGGLADGKAFAGFQKRADKNRTAEMHGSAQGFLGLLATEWKLPMKLFRDPAEMTSLAISFEDDRMMMDLWVPTRELRTMVHAVLPGM